MQKLALVLVASLALPLAAHAQTARTKVKVTPNAVTTSSITGHDCHDATGKLVKCAKTETVVRNKMTPHGPVTKTAVSKAVPCVKGNGKVKTCVTKTKTVTPG